MPAVPPEQRPSTAAWGHFQTHAAQQVSLIDQLVGSFNRAISKSAGRTSAVEERDRLADDLSADFSSPTSVGLGKHRDYRKVVLKRTRSSIADLGAFVFTARIGECSARVRGAVSPIDEWKSHNTH
jgi:hypothetical protein